MQGPDDRRISYPTAGGELQSHQADIVNYAELKSRRRFGAGCLLWSGFLFVGLLSALVIVIAAANAGWNAGVATARANSSATVEAELRQQCELIAPDLAAGRLELAAARFEALARVTPAPACLFNLAPTATAHYLGSLASPTPLPTATSASIEPTAAPPAQQPTAAPGEDNLFDYDLTAMLEEARADLNRRDYPAAIDTLDAIINLDGDFQRALVRQLYLEALVAQALLLYRSFNLSEAIVLTERAEAVGSIADLEYERSIALLYLKGQRHKLGNPAEAVRAFSDIVYVWGHPNYMNGQVMGELQEALQNYADALALQGDHCLAQEQYAAALELQPAYTRVNRGALSAKQNQAALACNELESVSTPGTATTTNGTPMGVGVRVDASPAPVGQSG